MSRLLDAVRTRHRASAPDERGSMVFYLVLAIVGMSLGALMVPMIVTSSQTTRSDTSRVHALDAAQAGINVMLGQLRAAQTDGVGTSRKLPCTSTTGTVNSTGPASYTVKVDYYMSDPVTSANPALMRCVPGYGTFDPVAGGFVPRFARITSVGKDGPPGNGTTTGRTLQTTYIFKTTNSNITGGWIRIYPADGSTLQLCMDGASATPSAGTVIKLATCLDPPKDQQIFAYRSDLTIQLLSSIGAAYPRGLCLDTAKPPRAGNTIVVNACSELGSPTYSQQWSFNDNGGLQSSLSTSATTPPPPGGTNLSSLCINVASQTVGTQLTLQTCVSGTNNGVDAVHDPRQAWIPSPAVGAGNAQPPQLINYYEFGRCLDVTGTNVNADHLIDYPCKQNPYPGAVLWNQKFTLPTIPNGGSTAAGQIYTNSPSGKYCLTAPSNEGGYVLTKPCSDTNALQRWTVYNGSPALSYSQKYQIMDNNGRCLGLTAVFGSEQWSAINSDRCTGATEQKWNATPNLGSAVIQDYDEIPNS